MNAYNELDGVPCAAAGELLTTMLRDEWGFTGCVVSDYFSIRQLADYHRFALDGEDAAAQALAAGLDVELPSVDCYGAPLLAALASGTVSQDVVDDAVRRVLRTKFELGLFEQPFVDVGRAARLPEPRLLARELVRKSLVLLRNDGALPLAADVGRVAVIGPCAGDARNLYGDYAYPAHVESLRHLLESGGEQPFFMPLPTGLDVDDALTGVPTVVDALRERLGDRVGYAPGCDVGGDSREGFDEAVALARESDVAILVLGDRSGLTPECTSGETRDRSSLDLPGVQEELAAAVASTGTPVVLVLVVGRPCGSAELHERSAAVLLAWLPGEEGACALADVLVGEASPGGKLPVSFPRSAGQIPVFYGHKISGGRSHWRGDYVDGPAAPLYPFGHGLSYTRFELAAAVRQSEVTWDEAIEVDVDVSNVGGRAGDEVVQLYVRDPHASVTRPVLELKAFARVELAPGESRRVTFDVPVARLGFTGRDLEHVVEPGLVELFVGASSADLVAAGSATVVAGGGLPPPKAF
jgi:beta-glucosidase